MGGCSESQGVVKGEAIAEVRAPQDAVVKDRNWYRVFARKHQLRPDASDRDSKRRLHGSSSKSEPPRNESDDSDCKSKSWYYISPPRVIVLAIVLVVAGLIIYKAVFLGFRHRHHRAEDNVAYIPLHAPSYPLAVRNPYFSAWLPGNKVPDLPNSRARFWSGEELTWSLMARVNGTTYNLFGMTFSDAAAQDAKVISATYTSTHTTFILSAGDVDFSIVFLSPVNAKDYVRQSLPFSYLTVSVLNLVHRPSNIQLYSDIDDTWNGQNTKYPHSSSWKATTVDSTSIWQIDTLDAKEYSQGGPNGQMALWGATLYATKSSSASKLTMGAGPSSAVRSNFMRNGNLSALRVASWALDSVTAFVHDLGTIVSPVNVTFALGYYRDCDVKYMDTCRVAYYKSRYPDPISAVKFFLDDYNTALVQSLDLDSSIEERAIAAAGPRYADLVALSTRQTMGGIDLTLPADLNTTDFMVFMKEISSDGNVNTIVRFINHLYYQHANSGHQDVIFPSSPQFYMLDPEYIRYLLEPVLQYLATDRWTRPFAIHDIGSNYPIADGHDKLIEEDMPVEESGNLLILAYMYSTAAGNTTWAERYRYIFQGYADYLVEYGLYPARQLSTVDPAGPQANQTNLAIKAAVALNAFGVMTGLVNYSSIGIEFARRIYNDGLGTDAAKTHFLSQYGHESSWTTPFNLFPDRWLKLNTFDSSAYEMQSSFYKTVRATAGVPLDSALHFTSTQWDLWAGATSSNVTMGAFVHDIWAYVTNGLNADPFGDRFFVSKPEIPGKAFGNRARPVVGGHWCAMALQGIL
ncbi:MAG: hypothetical protein M1818_003922 [Claussenomyces sp. TS43310]|nr:MAG: hypothetical protein M1818_003922 [Claussenomyces sp. TS43310]